ncbi:hypothetical protein [Mycobacterium haemophilum]|nr:hypothetical protein [Mycobacterium haemophilum]
MPGFLSGVLLSRASRIHIDGLISRISVFFKQREVDTGAAVHRGS